MNISSPLIAEMKDKGYRDGYVSAQISLGLPSKIRALRAERKWTQGDLAKLAKMAQPRISEIETPGERKLNLDTLQRIASALDVGLEVNFVSFGELISRNEGFDPDSFDVPSFESELAEAKLYAEMVGKTEKGTVRHSRYRTKCPHRGGLRRKKRGSQNSNKHGDDSNVPSASLSWKIQDAPQGLATNAAANS